MGGGGQSRRLQGSSGTGRARGLPEQRGPGDTPQSGGGHASAPGTLPGATAAIPRPQGHPTERWRPCLGPEDVPQSGGSHAPTPGTPHGAAAAMPRPWGCPTEWRRPCPGPQDTPRSSGGHASAPRTSHRAAVAIPRPRRLQASPGANGCWVGAEPQPATTQVELGAEPRCQKKAKTVRLIVRCPLSDLHVVNFAGCQRVHLIARCALWS